jgi:hypothetical protein
MNLKWSLKTSFRFLIFQFVQNLFKIFIGLNRQKVIFNITVSKRKNLHDFRIGYFKISVNINHVLYQFVILNLNTFTTTRSLLLQII